MRRTGLVAHERFFWHDPGPSAGGRRPDGVTLQVDGPSDHPETKRRLLGLLDASGYSENLTRIAPRKATRSEIGRFHTTRYMAEVEAMSDSGFGQVGQSAYVGAGSFDIACLAAGGGIVAVNAVLDGTVDNCYALLRPAGHHALADSGMGFCLFNNVVLAAMHARAERGIARIAIVDWDVHHGNGTQAAFYDDPNTLVLSIHQDGRFPLATGKLDERGSESGFGANLNVPLMPGCGHGAYAAVFEQVVGPALRRFKPDLILISSGYDAGGFDSMAHMMCHSDTFRMMATTVLEAARDLCSGRLVVLHEGGYSTYHVPFCGLAVIETLAGHSSGVVDPYLSIAKLPYQDVQPHQAALIAEAAALVPDIPTI